jgi:large subunit ribosomal protein L18e
MSSRSTNPELLKVVSDLKRISRKNKVAIWEKVADSLSKPKRSRPEINVGQIQRYVANGDVIAVPGRVLGAGNMQSKVTVGAYKFTNQARQKIEKAGGRCLSLLELAEKYPKGSGVKIMSR